MILRTWLNGEIKNASVCKNLGNDNLMIKTEDDKSLIVHLVEKEECNKNGLAFLELDADELAEAAKVEEVIEEEPETEIEEEISEPEPVVESVSIEEEPETEPMVENPLGVFAQSEIVNE